MSGVIWFVLMIFGALTMFTVGVVAVVVCSIIAVTIWAMVFPDREESDVTGQHFRRK